MNRYDIQSALKRVGSSQSEIARNLGISEKTARDVIAHGSRSSRVERRVSEITGLPLHQLWPQWYAKPSSLETSHDLMDAIPARLNAERDRLGFSSATMADLGSVTAAVQQSYECGAQTPHALYLARLARATHFDALYVITGRRESGKAQG